MVTWFLKLWKEIRSILSVVLILMVIIVIVGGIITGKYGAAVVKLSVSASGVALLCTTINELNKSGT